MSIPIHESEERIYELSREMMYNFDNIRKETLKDSVGTHWFISVKAYIHCGTLRSLMSF